MSNILFGMARPILTATVAGQERLMVFEPVGFELQTNVEVVKSKKFNTEGQVVTAGSALRSVESILTMNVEAINWQTMQIAHGELSSTTTNVEIPELKFATVPATAPYEINDTAFTVAGAPKIAAAVYTGNKAQSLTRGAGPTPAAGEFVITAGKLTVPAALAGVTIGYRVMPVVATCESIGVASVAQVFNSLSFSGILTTDDPTNVYKIVIPTLSRESEPSITIAAPTSFSLQYTLLTTAGKRRAYDLYKIPVV